MALTEETIIDRIEVLENGSLQVRRANVIKRDGVEISRQYHREVLFPSLDIPQDQGKITDVATAVWTPEVVDAYTAAVAAMQAARQEASNGTFSTPKTPSIPKFTIK